MLGYETKRSTMRITTFKIPRPKKFEYQPRYYDADKERAVEREKRIARELENQKKSASGDYIPASKSDLRFGFRNSRSGITEPMQRTRFLIKLVTLVLAVVITLLLVVLVGLLILK